MLDNHSSKKTSLIIILILITLLISVIYFSTSKSLLPNDAETKAETKNNEEKTTLAATITQDIQQNNTANTADAQLSRDEHSSSSTDDMLEDEDPQYIVDCTDLAFASNKKQEDIILQQFNDYKTLLTQSKELDHQYVAIISQMKELNRKSRQNQEDIEQNSENSLVQAAKENLFQLAQLFQHSPQNKLYYSDLLRQCKESFDENICSQTLFDQANMVDNNNAALWHHIAIIKQNNNDHQGAIEALIQANKKTQYNNYDYNRLLLIEQTLTELSTLNFQNKFLTAWGANSTFPNGLSDIFKFCQDNMQTSNNANVNHQLSDICYQVGVQLATQSQTSLPQRIGLSIQSLYFQQHNNQQAAQELQEKIKQNASFYQDEQMIKSMALVFYDERLARDWLNLAIEKGERIATEQLKADAIVYSQNPNYAPCRAENN